MKVVPLKGQFLTPAMVLQSALENSADKMDYVFLLMTDKEGKTEVMYANRMPLETMAFLCKLFENHVNNVINASFSGEDI